MANTLGPITLWDGERDLGPVELGWDGAVIERIDRLPGADAAPGLSVIPGLIDTHVHLIGFAGEGTVDFLNWPLVTRPEEQVLHGLAHAQRALDIGVTTLRDLSADDVQFSLRRALDAGVVDGPRVLAHGMVSMTAGHGDLFTPPAFPLRKPTADGPDECRKLVRQWARAGADGIKIATSGGVLSVGDRASWRNHSPAEIDAIVEEAHALGMRVAAHAHTEEGIRTALDAGVDSIEHATLVSDELADLIAARGIPVAPTLLINDAIAAGRTRSSAAQQHKAAELVADRDRRMRRAADRGVDFVLGTDANGEHVRFGDQHDELRRMAQIMGYSAERTLQAATSRAADAIGRGDLGRLRPGAAADFVVVSGRPWEELATLTSESIVAVVVRGRVVRGRIPVPDQA